MKLKRIEEPAVNTNRIQEGDPDFMMSIHDGANKRSILNTIIGKIKKTIHYHFFDENLFRLKKYRTFKAKHLNHHPKSIEQFERFYRRSTPDLKLFELLVQHNGIPDIQNNYAQYQENHYLYHNDLLFLKDVEKVLNYFFTKDDLRQREIQHHWQFYQTSLPMVDKAKELRAYLDKQKELLIRNQDALFNYFKHLDFDKKDPEMEANIEKIKAQYDQELTENGKIYLNTANAYNSLLLTLPSTDVRDDYYLFEDVLYSLNCGFIMLLYGDFFLSSTFNKISIENLRLFFSLCIVFTTLSYNNEELINNLKAINERSQSEVLNPDLIERIKTIEKDQLIHNLMLLLNPNKKEQFESPEDLIDFLND